MELNLDRVERKDHPAIVVTIQYKSGADSPGASLFRVIESEGCSGIRPSAGAGVAAFKIRPRY